MAKQPGVVGRVGLSLFFGVFLAAGLGFFAAIAPGVARHAGTYFWDEVPCTMVESRVVPEATVEGGAAGWHVRYAYVVDGRDYTGWRVTVNDAVGDARDNLRLSQQLAPGTATTCLVNPRDPDEAVLRRQSGWVLLTPLFPLIFVGVGGGGIWFAWRRAQDETPRGLTVRAARRVGAERNGLVVGMLFGGVFLVAGVALTHVLFVRPVLGVLAARSWLEVPCTIVASEVAEHDSDDGTTYSIEITYRYTVADREYLSNRYRFMSGSSSGYRAKARFVERHPPGSPATCFVNPADPTDAVFDRRWSGMMWLGLIPVAFALVGGGLLVAMVKQWRQPAAGPAFRVAAPAGAPGAGRITSPGTSGVVPGDGIAADGPVELVPAASRGLKVLGTLLVAVFWNGIVSVFLVQLFRGDGGGFSWFLALFLTPFVVIGLVLIGAFASQVLALSNPVPRLTLNRRVLRPGERLEVDWQMRGRVQALRRLRLSLEGREEATYRRGTDTRTDREVFATVDLLDTGDPATMAAGRVLHALPPRLMHTFTAKNNKIVWALRVRGEIPRWPDVDEEFVVTLAPPARGDLHHG